MHVLFAFGRSLPDSLKALESAVAGVGASSFCGEMALREAENGAITNARKLDALCLAVKRQTFQKAPRGLLSRAREVTTGGHETASGAHPF